MWARMEIGPALPLAAGADSNSIRGCGGECSVHSLASSTGSPSSDPRTSAFDP